MAADGSQPTFAQAFSDSVSEFCRFPPSSRIAGVVFVGFFWTIVPTFGS